MVKNRLRPRSAPNLASDRDHPCDGRFFRFFFIAATSFFPPSLDAPAAWLNYATVRRTESKLRWWIWDTVGLAIELAVHCRVAPRPVRRCNPDTDRSQPAAPREGATGIIRKSFLIPAKDKDNSGLGSSL
jgi:hypothetical protein